MPRYIDADLIPYAESKFGSFDDCAYRYDINEIPTADVAEVKHGTWLVATVIHYGVKSKHVTYRCSVCGRLENEKEPYCNCGAKMDGKGEKE